MEGNDDEDRFGWMAKEAMRAGRVVQIKARLEQRPNNIGGRARRQARHGFQIVISMRSRFATPDSIGISSPCLSKLSR